jgi:hypothetical protein
MDSLFQLEYIIERERSRTAGPQHPTTDALHITTRPLIDRLRRMLDLLRTARRAVRYA